MTYELFSKINCFDDMVEANLSYLRIPTSDCNDRDYKVSSPNHLGPLRKESELIVDCLQNLCRRHRVMTMGSQPAYTLERDRRQRGFIGGVISLPGVSLPCLGAALDQVGGLEYCLYRRIDNLEIDRNRLSLERFEHVNVLGHCIVSQCWRDQSWSTEEGTRACCGGYDWGEDRFCYLETYEGCNMYGSYSVTEDPSIILFDVADDSFDLSVTHCCDKLHEAIDLAKDLRPD